METFRINCIASFQVTEDTMDKAKSIIETAMSDIPHAERKSFYFVNNEKYSIYENEAIEDGVPNPFLYLRKIYGFTQADFSNHLGIPIQTIRSWEQGLRTPPDYVYGLIRKVLENETNND